MIHLALQGVAHDVILDGHSCSKSCKDFIDQADWIYFLTLAKGSSTFSI